MVAPSDSVVEIIRKYVTELNNHNIPVREVILFGSHAMEVATEESDIDVAIVSEAFTDDRFEDRRRIVPLRRKIDSRIEPMPFTPETFSRGGNLIDEIRSNGIKVNL
jgi:hypothetical protein